MGIAESQVSGVTGNRAIQLIGSQIGVDFSMDHSTALFTLSGGTTYCITNVIVTNASTSLTNCTDAQLWLDPAHTVEICTISNLSSLVYPQNALTFENGSVTFNIENEILTGSEVYFQNNNGQGAPATADIYLLGFIIN